MSVNEVARPSVILNSQQAEERLKELRKLSAEAKRELSKIKISEDPQGYQAKKREIQGIEKEMNRLKKQSLDTTAILKNLNGTSLRDLNKAAQQLKKEMNGLNRSSAEYANKASQYRQINAEIKKHYSAINDTSTSWGRLTNGASRYFSILTMGAVSVYGVIAGARKLISENIKLSDSFADVMKTTGLTRKEVGELYKDFNKLNTRTARSELLALAEEGGRLGFNTKKDLMAFIEVGNQLKTALGDDLGGNAEVAIKSVGKLTNIFKVGEKYGVDFKEAMMMVGSSINEVAASSTAQADYLIKIMNRMAGVADQADLSADSVIGYASVLDQLAQSEEVSGTTLNRVMIDMFKDAALYADVAGQSTEDFLQLLRTDANEAFLLMLEGLNSNNEGFDTMVTKLDSLQLDGVRSIQVLTALAGATDKIRHEQKLANTALEEGTSLTKEYNIRNENLAGSWAKIGNYIRDKFINSGAEGWFSRIIGKVAELTEIPLSTQLREENIELNTLVSRITDVNTPLEVQKTLREELNGQYGDLLGNLSAESATNEELAGWLNEVNAQYVQRYIIESNREQIQKRSNRLGELTNKKIEEQISFERLLNTVNSDYKLGLDLTNKSFEEKIKLVKEALKGEADYNEGIMSGVRTAQNEQAKSLDLVNQKLVNYGITERLTKKAQEDLNEQMDLSNKVLEEAGLSWDQFNKKVSQNNSSTSDKGGKKGSPGLSPEELAKLAADRKKQLEEEAKFREELILGAKTLIEQEEIAFNERLKKAGVFGKDKKKLTADELKALEILEKQHKDNIAKINDAALNDDIAQQQKAFDAVTMQRQQEYNEQLLALGNNEEAKEALKGRFREEELRRQIIFLDYLSDQISKALTDGTWEGINIEDQLLSDEQKENLIKKFSELGVEISNLKLLLGDTGDEKSKKSYGLSIFNWAELETGLEKAIVVANEARDLLAGFYDFKRGKEDAELRRTEKNVEQQKESLEKQLDAGLITQEQYYKRVANLEDNLDSKRAELTFKQAKREKALRIFDSIITTATAVVMALASAPPPFNMVLAKIVGALGLAQTALITATPIPQYYEGLYDVIGAQDGKKYSAPVIKDPGTGMLNQPSILAGELPEIIIDPVATRNLQINYPEAIQAIKASAGIIPQFASGDYSKISTTGTKTETRYVQDPLLMETLIGVKNLLSDLSRKGVITKFSMYHFKEEESKYDRMENRTRN